MAKMNTIAGGARFDAWLRAGPNYVDVRALDDGTIQIQCKSVDKHKTRDIVERTVSHRTFTGALVRLLQSWEEPPEEIGHVGWIVSEDPSAPYPRQVKLTRVTDDSAYFEVVEDGEVVEHCASGPRPFSYEVSGCDGRSTWTEYLFTTRAEVDAYYRRRAVEAQDAALRTAAQENKWRNSTMRCGPYIAAKPYASPASTTADARCGYHEDVRLAECGGQCPYCFPENHP